jgi:hypothetical protein
LIDSKADAFYFFKGSQNKITSIANCLVRAFIFLIKTSFSVIV